MSNFLPFSKFKLSIKLIFFYFLARAILLSCAEKAILALSDLLRLQDEHNITTGNKELCVHHLGYFIGLNPEPLGRCLTALFCVLIRTPLALATLSHLHLLPPDPQVRLDPESPVAFRLLATFLLSSATTQPSVIESYCTAVVRQSFSDLSPHMAQLISLLSSAFSSHSTKKALLGAIVDALMDSAGVDSLRGLRLLVLLRYQLHFLFDPPSHLNAQILPAILGEEEKDKKAKKATVWEFPSLVGQGPTEGYFYDLLCQEGKSKNRSSGVSPPPPDGLAIMTLVARSDYDEVFTRLLHHFDAWWGKLAASLPHAAYGVQLSWRLLEILPPGPEFVDRLSAAVNGDEVFVQSSAQVCGSRLIYLLVLLDRLRRLPTSATSSSATAISSSVGKESKRSKHWIEAIAVSVSGLTKRNFILYHFYL